MPVPAGPQMGGRRMGTQDGAQCVNCPSARRRGGGEGGSEPMGGDTLTSTCGHVFGVVDKGRVRQAPAGVPRVRGSKRGSKRGNAGSQHGNAGSQRGNARSQRGNARSQRGNARSQRGNAGQRGSSVGMLGYARKHRAMLLPELGKVSFALAAGGGLELEDVIRCDLVRRPAGLKLDHVVPFVSGGGGGGGGGDRLIQWTREPGRTNVVLRER